MLSCVFCEISKNTFFNRTPPAAASVYDKKWQESKHTLSELTFMKGYRTFCPLEKYILTNYSPVLLFYTPWKQQEIFRFFDVFTEYRKATLGCNG